MRFEDVRNRRVPPESMPQASLLPERRRHRTASGGSPSSLVLDLIVFGLVATATISAFYGIGLWLLADQKEKTATLDYDVHKNAKPQHLEILPRLYGGTSPADRAAPPAKGTTEISRAAPRITDGDQSVSTTQLRIPRVTKEVQEDTASISRGAVQTQIPVPGTGIALSRWGVGYSLEEAQEQALKANVVHGRPLYLWMTLHGTQAAVDRMRADHRLVIEIHWTRKSGSGPSGNTERTKELTIGSSGLASTFEEQIRRRGYFERHIWQRRDALGPGMWTVSLTSSNGQVLLCGEDHRPCDITINVE